MPQQQRVERLQNVVCSHLGEDIGALSIRQAAASQKIKRLRFEAMIVGPREGKNVYYKICVRRVRPMLKVLDKLLIEDQKVM